MIRSSIIAFFACATAVAVAWKLGGVLGNGVLVGFATGAGLGGLGVLYQRHIMRTRPERAFHAFAALALAKLAVLLVGGVTLRFLQATQDLVHWKSFLIAYAATVALIVPLGTVGALRNLRTQVPPAVRAS